MPLPPAPRLPIGFSDFRQLREPGVLYVDKTDFVTHMLAAPEAVVLVPRPRRFGKTVNLSTIRCFVEKSPNDTSALFEGARTFDDALDEIRREVRRAYREHRRLLDEGALDPEDAEPFRRILRAEGPRALYAESLRELSRHLARHHGERVFILIDEYDTPIQSIQRGEDERRILDFFRVFLSGFLRALPGGKAPEASPAPVPPTPAAPAAAPPVTPRPPPAGLAAKGPRPMAQLSLFGEDDELT